VRRSDGTTDNIHLFNWEYPMHDRTITVTRCPADLHRAAENQFKQRGYVAPPQRVLQKKFEEGHSTKAYAEQSAAKVQMGRR
jgi:hypothetical protein